MVFWELTLILLDFLREGRIITNEKSILLVQQRLHQENNIQTLSRVTTKVYTKQTIRGLRHHKVFKLLLIIVYSII